ncbi:MAG: GNAT family N-acetyltransferase [Candidatus Woesearchaeota archaeon]
MKIRAAKQEDLQELLSLFIEYNTFLWTLESKKESFFKEPKKQYQKYILKSLQEMIRSKKQKILVAKTEGKIIGSVSGWVNKYENSLFEDDCRIGTLGYLIVKKEFQKKGISTELKNRLFEWFKKKNCEFVNLEVSNKNPAKQIYERWGFEKYSEKMKIPLDKKQ